MSKGLKRICMNCGMRFYDLDKSSIICPGCETEFTGEEKVKGRRGRTAAETPATPAKEAEAKPAGSDRLGAGDQFFGQCDVEIAGADNNVDLLKGIKKILFIH